MNDKDAINFIHYKNIKDTILKILEETQNIMLPDTVHIYSIQKLNDVYLMTLSLHDENEEIVVFDGGFSYELFTINSRGKIVDIYPYTKEGLAICDKFEEEGIYLYISKQYVKDRKEILLVLKHFKKNNELVTAIKEKKYAIALKLLEEGADVDAENEDGESLLMIVLHSNETTSKKIEIVNILLTKGANIEHLNKEKRTPLFYAIDCIDENLELVTLLVEYGAHVNAQDDTGNTPLIIASAQGYTKTLEYLLEHDVDIDKQNFEGETALMMAISVGWTFIVEKLIKKGALVDVLDKYQNTALFHACYEGRIEIAKILIENGANVHLINSSGYTPLMIASEQGEIEIVKLLLEKGVDMNAHLNGETAYLFAAKKGYTEIISLFLKQGLNIDKKKGFSITMLMYASFYGHKKTVEYLIKNEANLEDTDNDGNTALMWATRNNKIITMKVLLNNGANVNAQNRFGETALFQSFHSNNTFALRLLLQKGANIHITDRIGKIPFMQACEKGNINALTLLLKHNASLNTSTIDGFTPLMYTSVSGKIKNAEYLISKNINIEIKNDYGLTALMVATIYGNQNMVHFLCNNGAKVNAKIPSGSIKAFNNKYDDKQKLYFFIARKDIVSCEFKVKVQDGDTAFIIATKKKNLRLMKTLLECGANKNAQNNFGSTALHVLINETRSMYAQEYKILDFLLEKQIDVSKLDSRGQSALMLASKKGFNSVVKKLSNCTIVEKTQKDTKGNTPLIIAAQTEKTTVVEDLLEQGYDPNEKNNLGRNALMETFNRNCFIGERALNTTRVLIDKIENINEQDNEGKTVLMMASEACLPDVVDFLIKKGASIDLQDNQGNTALMLATNWENLDTLRTLIYANADFTIRNEEGNTALDIAKKNYARKVISLFEESF